MTCGAWTEETAPAPLSLLYGFWASSSTDMFAVGGTFNLGKIIHNNGTGWVVQPIPTVRDVRDVLGFAPNDVYAVGRGPNPTFDGVLLHYDGSVWSIVAGTPSVTTNGFYSDIWGTSGNDLYILGWDYAKAVLFHYDGSSWSDMQLPSPPIKSAPGDVWGTSGNDLWVVGAYTGPTNTESGGVVYHFDGSIWSEYAPPQTTALYAIHGSSECEVVAAGKYNTGIDYQAATMYYDGLSWVGGTTSQSQVVEGMWAGETNRTMLVGYGSGTADGKIGLDDGLHGSTWGAATQNLWLLRSSFRIPGTDTFYVVGDGNSAARLSHATCN